MNISNIARESEIELFFWRSRGGLEVDFVLYGQAGIYAIEVKNSARIREQDLRPVLAFLADYPQSRAMILYRGTERLLKRNILCLPCEEFLQNLTPVKELGTFFQRTEARHRRLP